MKSDVTPKFDITLAVPGLPFNGNTFDQQSLGGSETAAYYMGRALARLGHRVTVFCNTPERVACDDVDYLPLGMFQSYAEHVTHDVCVVQRLGEIFAHRHSARFSALWCHDLAMGRAEGTIKGTAWGYDKLFVLSDFMRKQYQDVIGLPADVFYQTRNGVDLDLVARVRGEVEAKTDVRRNPLSLIYTARPERGLDVLLQEILPRVLEREPQARLFLARYDNQVAEVADFYARCQTLAAKFGDRVVDLGSLTKAQLYEAYHVSGLYVYPLPSLYAPDFDEVSCITAMEAQACGLPIVTTARGALVETVAPGAGKLVAEPVHTTAYYEAFADEALRLMQNPHEWRQASAAGFERAATLGWDAVAADWTALFEREIRANNASLGTLVNHFYRRSDIYAARAALALLPVDDEQTRWVRTRIDEDWAFTASPDGFREQYERIGGTHDPAVIDWAPREPRYAALLAWLRGHPEIRTAIDYGCAHGAYAVNLLRELPELSITGVDIDLHGIQLGCEFADKFGVAARWRGVVGDHSRLSDATLPEMRERYQVAILQEVLEHVPDPGALLAALEERVEDGGIVYITVPYGPWEYTDYANYPYRAHVREFDTHDLHDLLDVKGKGGEVTINAMPYGLSPVTGDPLGWWVVQYRVTAENRGKIGAIDLERKLWLQHPRQTVSAAIIAGPNAEENLHWCLRSLVDLADEVVVVDCGMSDEAKRVLGSYAWRGFDPTRSLASQRGQRYFLNVRVFPGVDPKTEGFETPRNLALERCTQDWVLWIDTDEKLVQPDRMHKYLRKNTFQGYSIRQHHFAVDTTFDADLPVRMFRNNGRLRFFGMIHEHPEEKLNQGPGLTIVLSDVHIPHVGYLIESGRQVRFNRNWPMLQADIAKYPERLLQKHFIMRDEILLCTYELGQNGGRVTDAIRERCHRVIATYRQYFLGKGHFTNIDPISYYSQACTILGIGFDSVMQLRADKIDAKPNGHLKARFATSEDFLTEVTRRAKDAARPFDGKYW